jgi:hypothetical protein
MNILDLFSFALAAEILAWTNYEHSVSTSAGQSEREHTTITCYPTAEVPGRSPLLRHIVLNGEQ